MKAQGEQAGSIVEKEAAIHVSNVALWDAGAGRRVKTTFKTGDDGSKVRVDRKSGASV
jgi:large subunit ribosomal protein L24